MIHGVVNDTLEATVHLLVRGSGGYKQDIEAIIDTGLNGFLTLSPEPTQKLALARIGKSRVRLASGKEEILDLYEVEVLLTQASPEFTRVVTQSRFRPRKPSAKLHQPA